MDKTIQARFIAEVVPRLAKHWRAGAITRRAGVLDAIEPEMRLAEAHAGHPRFGWDMRKRGAEGLIAGFKLLDPFPEVDHFVSSDGGWMFLLSCVAESVRLGGGDRKSVV